MMEAATQPILCCVGGAVAGNPTQFVMERMLDQAQLDWRVITVEVQPEELYAALPGLKAMRFSAIQILEPYAKPAAEAMFPGDPTIDFISAITSAGFHSGVWEGWHATGPAILRLVGERHPWSKTACIVCGDSVRSRSTVAACRLTPPAKLLWLDGPTLQPMTDDGLSGQPWLLNCQTEQLSELASQLPADAQAIVVVGESEPQMQAVAKHLQSGMTIAENLFPCYAAPGQTDSWDRKQTTWSKIFSASEQLVSAMAHDFEKWTGRPADIAHMRDAFDEYCDF